MQIIIFIYLSDELKFYKPCHKVLQTQMLLEELVQI